MPILYKAVTAVLAFTGCISLFITGQLNPIMTIGGIAVVLGYYRFFRSRQPAPAWAVGSLSLATLIVFMFDSLIMTGDVFIAVGHLTITFQALKSFDLKEPWDHLQVYFMTLLQLIMASELTRSFAFGVVFLIFMMLLVTAMVLSHFLKEEALGKTGIQMPVILISLLTLIATAVFFVSIPRTAQKFLGGKHTKRIKTAGFSDRMDFGSFGEVKLDPTVVMRVETGKDQAIPYYWRGMSLNYFDGLAWRNTIKEKSRIKKYDDEFIVSPYDKKMALRQKVFLEPLDSDVVFGLAEISGIKAEVFYLTADDAGDIFLPGKPGGRMSYTVYSSISDSYYGKTDRRYLQLPEGVEKISGLAGNIASGAATDIQKAFLIEQYLKKNYAYSLSTSTPPEGLSPVEDFLFNSKKGYCEHYATSMVIMLRCLGVPARIVTGFYGGERNKYGEYIIVRQSDAHSWVEAVIDGKWKRFDPTPAVTAQERSAFSLLTDSVKLAWSRYVVGFSSDGRKEIIGALVLPFDLSGRFVLHLRQMKVTGYHAVILPVSALFLGLLYFITRRMGYKRYDFVTEKYVSFRKLLKKKGMPVTISTTAGDMLKITGNMEAKSRAEEFIKLYEEYRFGEKVMSEGNRERYLFLYKELTQNTK
jgi:protein-glutamine gamma-glutamyltransferase